jgi:predicted amino acid racemase
VGATLTVDLAKIEANARALADRLPQLAIVAVTKATCGSPEVARAMLAGGACAIGESRLANIERLRQAGIAAPVWLLRAPTPEQAADAVRLADVSLNTELATVQALDAAAGAARRAHRIVVMVELGDLREGLPAGDLPAFLDVAAGLDHVRVEGIGVNLACYGGVMPTRDNLGRLVELAKTAAGQLGRPLLVSGGNSATLPMALAGSLPPGIDNLRVGESILLGVDTLAREPLLDLQRDAFMLSAPVIECKVKPSVPIGEICQDAFGNRPAFAQRGDRRRAILAVGRQDTVPEVLHPVDPGIEVLGASSDHLVLDVEDLGSPPAVGDRVSFVPGYAALLQSFTSPYVEKVYLPHA